VTAGAYTLDAHPRGASGPVLQARQQDRRHQQHAAYFYQEVLAPARLAGSVLLVHETLNQAVQQRQAWVYNPGQRRVRRAPNVAYDNPGTASDGLRTNDMTDMFNGALDRFDWKLVGKKEMYVPYNSYKAHSDKGLDYKDIVRPGPRQPGPDAL
jgi:hypothetical protein